MYEWIHLVGMMVERLRIGFRVAIMKENLGDVVAVGGKIFFRHQRKPAQKLFRCCFLQELFKVSFRFLDGAHIGYLVVFY